MTDTAGPYLTMYDRAQAPAAPPKTDIALVYAGGADATHVWSVAEIHAQHARYLLPCWVASGEGAADGAAEGHACLNWLHAHKAPRGRVIAYDLETRAVSGKTDPDLEHEQSFRKVIADAGYWTMLYGSAGNLFGFPEPGGGYWVADPPAGGQTARPHLYPHGGVVGTQWRFAIPGEDWDLSVFLPAVRSRLWDTRWTLDAVARVNALEAEVIELGRLFRDYAV
jgi:hypothetical protein